MSDYFTITGKRTGHRWLVQIGTSELRTQITVRRNWENSKYGGIAYCAGLGWRFASRWTWWAIARARLHVWRSDRREHRVRVRASKVRRIALQEDQP